MGRAWARAQWGTELGSAEREEMHWEGGPQGEESWSKVGGGEKELGVLLGCSGQQMGGVELSGKP